MDPNESNGNADAMTSPTDFSVLSQELDGGDQGAATAAPPTAETPAAAAAPAAATAPDPDAPKPETVDATKIDGILTPDGKRVIPYPVLAGERQRSAQLSQALEESTNQVLALSEQLKQLQAGASTPGDKAASAAASALATDVANAAPEDMQAVMEAGFAEIDTESKWLGQSVRKLMAPVLAKMQQMAQQLEATGQRAQEAQAAAVSPIKQAVDDAIANVPIVAYWQDHGDKGDEPTTKKAWNYAKAIDAELREEPDWAKKPLTERFEEVQRRVLVLLGEKCVPENLREFIKAPPDPKAEERAALAKGRAALDKAPSNVGTLSDIPGGTPAAGSLAKELEDDAVSVGRLHDYFSNKPVEELLQVFRS